MKNRTSQTTLNRFWTAAVLEAAELISLVFEEGTNAPYDLPATPYICRMPLYRILVYTNAPYDLPATSVGCFLYIRF